MTFRKLSILIACEESQEVCKAFRALGHEAFSCDLKDCSGGFPEWHIKGDAVEALYSRKWDLVIAHPTCTRLTNSGVTWLEKRNLWEDLKGGIRFFNAFADYGKNGNRIVIENPIPHKYAVIGYDGVPGIGQYDQIIQPWQFGHMEQKATCLWLFGLPKLQETKNVYDGMMQLSHKERNRIHYTSPGENRAEIRSKTYEGIAKAMATQYSQAILDLESGKRKRIAIPKQINLFPPLPFSA